MLCLIINTVMGHANLYAYAGNQEDAPLHKTISITEKKINKAFERYDGEEPEIKSSVIPFKGAQKERAREALESVLFGMVIVSQGRLGDNCTAIVAACSNDEYGDGASIDEVVLIGLNGNRERDCEFTLELVSEGGLNAGTASVTGYRAEDFKEEERATDSDGEKKASSSDAAKAAGSAGTEKKKGSADPDQKNEAPRTEKKASPSNVTPILASSSNAAEEAEKKNEESEEAGQPFEEYYSRQWKKAELAGLAPEKEENIEPLMVLSRGGDITVVNVVMEEAQADDYFARFSVMAASDEVKAGEWMEFRADGSVNPVDTIRGIGGKAYFTLRFESDDEAGGEEYIEQMEGPEEASRSDVLRMRKAEPSTDADAAGQMQTKPVPTTLVGSEEAKELEKIAGYLEADQQIYPLGTGERWRDQLWYQIASNEEEGSYYYYSPRQKLAVIPIESGQTSQLSMQFAYPADLTPDGAALTAYAEYLNADEAIKSGPGAVGYVEEGEARVQNVAVRASEPGKSILQYAAEKEGAEASAVIATADGTIIQPDENGNYHVTAGTSYQARITFSSRSGMDAGRYYFQFPTGSNLSNAGGRLLLKPKNSDTEVDVGSWYIDSENRLIFDLADNIKDFTEITLGAIAQVSFEERDETYELDWDGRYQVVVKPLETETETQTKVRKWERDKTKIENADADKIYWEVEVIGREDSKIVGSTMIDTITTTDTHYYSPSDMDAGIEFMAFQYPDYDYHADTLQEHCWTVRPGDPGLIWTEQGWSYTIPETIWCQWHETEEKLGNDSWIYYVKYSSTKKKEGSYGNVVTYKNKVEIDGAEDTAHAETGEYMGSEAELVKTGTYNGETDTITWEIRATIPGKPEGETRDYYWYLWDSMKLKDHNDNDVKKLHNDLDKAEVKAIVNGHEIEVPKLLDAIGNETLVWEDHWQETDGNGTEYGRQINLYNQCTCTEETCPIWKEGCEKKKGNLCQCWNMQDDIQLIFTYTTDAKDLVESYGGLDYRAYNSVQLNKKQFDPNEGNNGKWVNVYVKYSSDRVPLPGIFTKQMTEKPAGENNYIAEFTITVNESMRNMADLTTDGQIEIIDTMSSTLIFLPETLVITTKDTGGMVETLQKDQDYQVAYDGNVVTIVLKRLGAYQYTLTYNAAIYIESGSGATSYENTASVVLNGREYSSGVEPQLLPQVTASGSNYSVKLIKTDQDDPEKMLEGAKFGLFAASGIRICTVTSDAEGVAEVKTDTSMGIAFYDHTVYYFQETEAPRGYVLDQTQYYFWFCDEGDKCTCESLCKTYENEKVKIIKVNDNQLADYNTIIITNKYGGPKLPETGGPGSDRHRRIGTAMMLSALIMLAGYTLEKRKRKNTG